jgi:hypothetical protein
VKKCLALIIIDLVFGLLVVRHDKIGAFFWGELQEIAADLQESGKRLLTVFRLFRIWL